MAARVLVVEDHPDIQAALAELLGGIGFDVRVADNGRVALDRLADEAPPAWIVLDLMMPVMDGWEFLEHLDATGPAPGDRAHGPLLRRRDPRARGTLRLPRAQQVHRHRAPDGRGAGALRRRARRLSGQPAAPPRVAFTDDVGRRACRYDGPGWAFFWWHA